MSDRIAGGGLLHRRAFLKIAGKVAGAGIGTSLLIPAQATESWETRPGNPPRALGSPSLYAHLEREQINARPFAPQSGTSSTPLQRLNGTLTPNGLHFERHHSGVPEIDPARHTLTVYGDVHRTLQFRYEDLLSYPMQSHLYFLECSGNSYRNTLPSPLDLTAGSLHGLFSCAEWTGVPLHYLLEEAGFDATARWVIAEGADAAGMTRSVPLELALDRVLIALYQNGEPLRPEQGYPMRLFVPGCEGNISVKWLKRLKLQTSPAYTREETSRYTDLLKDGSAEMFSLAMEVKSVITSPSGKMQLKRKGVYEVSGLAWSGAGAIRRVEVSADGGDSWADAVLQSNPIPLAPTRFRLPWRWQGQPSVLLSRAFDEKGNVQPGRNAALARYSPSGFYHYNGIQRWQVTADGRVKNVYL